MPKRAVIGASILAIGALLKLMASAKFLALIGLLALEDTLAVWLGSTIGFTLTSIILIIGFAFIMWFVMEKALKKRKGNWRHWGIVKVGAGAVFALLLLASVFSLVPYTRVEFSTVGAAITQPQQEATGTRLYIGEYHVHHWVIGVALMIAAFAIAFSTKTHWLLRTISPANGFIFGIGAVLFLDQLPQLIGMASFGV